MMSVEGRRDWGGGGAESGGLAVVAPATMSVVATGRLVALPGALWM